MREGRTGRIPCLTRLEKREVEGGHLFRGRYRLEKKEREITIFFTFFPKIRWTRRGGERKKEKRNNRSKNEFNLEKKGKDWE